MLDNRYNTFLTLCEVLNYTKTAQILHLTQPAVTQHIKYLEKEFNLKLFVQNGKTIAISEKGKILLEFVKKMKADSMQIKDIMQKSKEKVMVEFGATLTIGEYVLPEILYKLINRGYSTNMVVENTENLLDKISNGEIMFAVIEGFFDKSKFAYKHFKDEEFVAICSNFSEFSKKKCSIENLFAQNLILREKGSGTRDILEKYLVEKNMSIESFSKIIEIGSLNVIKNLVSSDIGISFMYKSAVSENVSTIDIDDFNVKRQFNFVYLKDSVVQKDIEEILEYMISLCK